MKKILLRCVLAFVMWHHATGQDDNAQACEDQFSWCSSQKMFCQTPYIQSICKSTCGLCTDATIRCQQHGCEYSCVVDNDDEVSCTCASGYSLNSDGKTCSDIDECANPSTCSSDETPVCRNFPGTYSCTTCSSLPGYQKYYGSKKCCKKNVANQCGQNVETGTNAPAGPNRPLALWPWTALLDIDGKRCTGVIISHEWILAAAHCFPSPPFHRFQIFALVGSRSTSPETQTSHTRRIEVAEVVVHNNYNFPNNDVALVRLSSRITNSWAARPVCLPKGEIPSENQRCWMSGFESFFDGTSVVSNLVDSGIVFTNENFCSLSQGRIGQMANFDNILCGRYAPSNEVLCPGETGGPVVCQRCDSCDWYVAGIMSFGDLCPNTKQNHMAFSSVESYEQWISRTTGIATSRHKSCASDKISWRPWTSWSACSQSCGSGFQTRSRVCRNGIAENSACQGVGTESQQCNTNICPSWGLYGEWTACSKTCESGIRRRVRSCIGGAVGDIGCHEGSNIEIQVCNNVPCAQWSQWSQWLGCSKTCGTNEMAISVRICNGGTNGEESCEGSFRRQRACELNPCPIWSEWRTWTSCTPSCGGSGVRRSFRECLNGNNCDGSDNRVEECLTPTCPPVYTEWSPCSVTCGTGTETRTRICPSNENGCEQTVETRECTLPSCPRHTSWSECSSTCGKGSRHRIKICTEGETQCSSSVELDTCSGPPCPPLWSRWSEWSDCSVSCGQGTESRVRSCLNEQCRGESSQSRTCQRSPCSSANRDCQQEDLGSWCEFADHLCQNSSYVQQFCPETCDIC